MQRFDTPQLVPCPYCHRPLRWAALQWVARGVFECERCGTFTDFSSLHPRDVLPATVAREPEAAVSEAN